MNDVFDDCERFDADFRPEAGRKPGLDVLPDDSYDFMIVSATGDRTQQSRDPIVRVIVRVLSGHYAGQECEWTWWLTRQESIDRIGGDLATLGFDTQLWQPPARPFSAELRKTLPRLAGMRFRGQVKRNDSQGKTYTNLYCHAVIAGAGSAPAPATLPPAHQTEEDLPF